MGLVSSHIEVLRMAKLYSTGRPSSLHPPALPSPFLLRLPCSPDTALPPHSLTLLPFIPIPIHIQLYNPSPSPKQPGTTTQTQSPKPNHINQPPVYPPPFPPPISTSYPTHPPPHLLDSHHQHPSSTPLGPFFPTPPKPRQDEFLRSPVCAVWDGWDGWDGRGVLS